MTTPEPTSLDQPDVWKGDALVATYLGNVRGGIPYGEEQIAMMLRVLGGFLGEVTSALDLGCGDGIIGGAIRSVWPGARLTLLDFSPAMLDAARRRFGDDPSVQIVEADFGAPAWTRAIAANAPFDAIVSSYAIHHQEDDRKRALYGEIFGLLRPGGVFVNIEHVASLSPAIAGLANELFVDTIHAHHDRSGGNRSREEIAAEFVHRPDKAANRLTPVETQLGWLREAGFADVDCYFKALELAVIGGRRPA